MLLQALVKKEQLNDAINRAEKKKANSDKSATPTDLPSKAAYSKTIEEQRSKLSTATDKGGVIIPNNEGNEEDAAVNISEECSQKSSSEIFREDEEVEESKGNSPKINQSGKRHPLKDDHEDDAEFNRAVKECLEKKESINDVFSSREASEKDSESSEEDSETCKEETPSPDDSVSPSDEANSENDDNTNNNSLYGKTQMEEDFARQREADKRERELLCKRNPVMMKRDVSK